MSGKQTSLMERQLDICEEKKKKSQVKTSVNLVKRQRLRIHGVGKDNETKHKNINNFLNKLTKIFQNTEKQMNIETQQYLEIQINLNI